MQTLSEIRELLDRHGLRPRRALGQNFLIDANLVRRLVDESGVGPGSLVLEVGPGTGTLTEALVERGCEVVACELDRGLAALIRERLPGVALVEGDCLDSKHEVSREVVARLGERAFSLVANLPYGAGTPLMLALMIRHPSCMGMWVTIQREVGERLLAGPGSRDYGPLGVIASVSGSVRRLATLGPECFWPRPEVTSVMVEWKREPTVVDLPRLEALCARVFGQRRKQLGSILGRGVWWPEGVAPERRAEELTPGALVALSERVV